MVAAVAPAASTGDSTAVASHNATILLAAVRVAARRDLCNRRLGRLLQWHLAEVKRLNSRGGGAGPLRHRVCGGALQRRVASLAERIERSLTSPACGGVKTSHTPSRQLRLREWVGLSIDARCGRGEWRWAEARAEMRSDLSTLYSTGSVTNEAAVSKEPCTAADKVERLHDYQPTPPRQFTPAAPEAPSACPRANSREPHVLPKGRGWAR